MKYFGKDKLISALVMRKANNKLPHAVLFHGDRGVGKTVMAQYLAALFICEHNPPCFSCSHCSRILKKIHPDVIYAGGEKYTVGGLRKIVADSQVKPNDCDKKIYIFQNADEMSAACQNTLLKLIEEPNAYSTFIFTAVNQNKLLDTIQSRIVSLYVEPADMESCKECLRLNGISDHEAEELSFLFQGNIGKCILSFENSEEKDAVEFAARVAASIAGKNEYEILKSFSAASKRGELSAAMPRLAEILRDAVIIKLHKSSKSKDIFAGLTGCDLPSSNTLASKLSINTLMKLLETIMNFYKTKDFNLNLQLAVTYYASSVYEIIG